MSTSGPHKSPGQDQWQSSETPQDAGKGIGTSDPGMIGYTLPEIRRLLTSLIQACAPDPEDIWSWSRWRRRRQYQARLCHFRRRGYALA